MCSGSTWPCKPRPEGHTDSVTTAVSNQDGAPAKPRRGELRIYLGAAPGVGKTFAMLGEARRRLDRGTDVVVGLVETHGRQKTADLLDGLEIVPRWRVEHRGRAFEEMDVEAILA